MEFTYTPYINREFEVLMDRIHPPRVCVDNDTDRDCTLVKVDSANKQGMLLEMVQVLTDLDLIISKSYISSDGGWLMDVFHVTDQQGNKITDQLLIDSIKEGICASRQIRPSMPEGARSQKISTEKMVLEMTGSDKPGLMSEMSAALTQLCCHVSGGIAWTHNGRAACIIFVEDTVKDGPPLDPCRASQVQAQLENVIEAHHKSNEQRSVKFAAASLTRGRTHTERRLHQLMTADRDYEKCCSCGSGNSDLKDLYAYEVCHKGQQKKCNAPHVRIESCKENGYSIINIRSRDRPKLLFDTVCALTDLQYVVHHAAIGSKGSTALQEYYVKPKDGTNEYSEEEKRRIVQCLIAATERRNSQGLKLDICTSNRTGLLWDVTRVFRENGLSITRAEMGICGEKAVGTFYVKETSGENVNPRTVEKVRQELGVINIVVEKKSSGMAPENDNFPTSTTTTTSEVKDGRKFSLGNMLWAQLERLSYSFRPIQS